MSASRFFTLNRPANERSRSTRLAATLLLFAMALIFVACRFYRGDSPALGYVQAFAEAALVGGLADWFAVTALFRRPLGLPIPHTAIIPNNKNRIAESLANFLQGNFLVPSVIARRMQHIDLAENASRVFIEPARTREHVQRLKAGASCLVADLLDAMDHDLLGKLAKSVLVRRLQRVDIAPLLGQALATAMEDGRHLPAMDAAIRWSERVLRENEQIIRQMVHDRAGNLLRWTGLDETLATAILDGLLKMFTDMQADHEHPLRVRAQIGLESFAHRLQRDSQMQRRIANIRDEILANPAMVRWTEGVWAQARRAIVRHMREPGQFSSGNFAAALQQVGFAIQADPRLQHSINRLVRRAVVGVSSRYGASIVKLVSETIRGWDAETITDRLENAVGRDLQYIRINGTLVGGLVGLVIHAIDRQP